MHAQQITYLSMRFVANSVSQSNPRTSFIHELHRSRPRKTTDARDRVFSLLGHFSAQLYLESLRLLEADYTKAPTEIYFEVAVRTLEGYETLETLNACQYTLRGKLCEIKTLLCKPC